jgi:ankyrin repeat protein
MLALFMTKELEHMSEEKEKTTVGYFFWDVRTRQNTAAAMLRTLIYQLLRKQPQLFVHIMDDYLMRKSSDLPPFSDESFTTLWRIFSAMINDDSHDTFYCVLDGLDECEKSSRDLFLDLLHQLLHASHHRNGNSRRKLKLLVTSRPLPGNTEQKFTPFVLQLELNKATSGHDVQLYIKKQVADLVNLGFSEARVARIEKALSSRCESTFLWVSLATQEMKKKPPWKAEKLVAQLPSGMAQLYAKLLANINTEFRTDVEHILMLVSTAFRPLTVKELATAHWLFRHPKATSLPDEESLREIDVYLGHCSSFLRYEETIKGDQTVHLCHSILMDCINVNPSRSHLQVFTTLIRNLQLDDMRDVKLECFPIGVSFNGKILFSVQIKEGIHSELKNETKIRKPQANALRHYACDFWSQHSVQCAELLRFSENKSWRWPWPPEFFFVASDRRIRNTHESIKAMKEDQSKWSICRAMSRRSHTIQTPEHMFIIASRSGCLPFVEYYTRTHLHPTSVEKISVKLLLAEALLEATESGCTPIVDFLLKNGADVYATPNFRFENLDQQPPFRNLIPTRERHYGKTPLHYASQNGDLNVATLLLAAKSDVKLQDAVGFTPLHWAVVTENFEMTELLLDNGSDAEIKDNKGASPLHYAAGYGKIQYPIISEKNREIICGYLLDRGAVGRDRNTESLTPLVCAIMCNLHGVVEILLETGAYDIHEPPLPTEKETSEIHMAASSQQYDLVYKLLLRGMSLSTSDTEGKTPLLVAAEVGDVEMVKLLLELGSDISAQDRHGRTALHLAAAGFYELPTRLEEGRFEVVRFLAETNRSLLEIEDDEGNLPEDHALASFDQDYTEYVDFEWGTSVMTAADEIGDRGAALKTHDWLEEQRLFYNSEP